MKTRGENRRSPNGSAGMTLIEVVVSIALLAILSVMIVTVMTQALSALSETRRRTNAAMSAAGNIETKRAADSAKTAGTDTVAVTIGGSTVTVSGKYVSDTESGITYKEFVPASVS